MDDTRKGMYIYLVFSQCPALTHVEKAIQLQTYLTGIPESQILKFWPLYRQLKICYETLFIALSLDKFHMSRDIFNALIFYYSQLFYPNIKTQAQKYDYFDQKVYFKN